MKEINDNQNFLFTLCRPLLEIKMTSLNFVYNLFQEANVM